MLPDLTAFARYARRLPGFLTHPVGAEEAGGRFAAALASREENFLHLIRYAVLPHARSPYRALLAHAGIEYGDVARMVEKDGVEGALARLFDAGVRVSHDEFKGRQPLRRSGLTLATDVRDFDNPLLGATLAGTTGASRGRGTRVPFDLDFLAYRVVDDWLTAAAHGDLDGRPVALWRPAPPGVAGLNNALLLAKRGVRIERWFAHHGYMPRRGFRRGLLLTGYTVLASRVWGTTPIPLPEKTPAEAAAIVAGWLAAKRAAGSPGLLNASASSCVRVCQAAQEHSIDIAGSVFRVGGEPFTEGKARVVRESGCRALAHYGMTEIGRIGLPCAAPEALDDVHLTSDRLAVLRRERPAGSGLGRVGAFHFTTLHPRSPKLMLNTESGDYGMITERDCGCAIGRAGLSRHLHSIRSYEKLTSEGMLFFGDELVSLLEQTLPSRFGGGPADYQLVEQEVSGLPRIHLVIHPRVGGVVESEVVSCLLEALADGGRPSRNMMAGIWDQAGSVRVERREPYLTASAKVLPLHILDRAGAPEGAPRKES